MNIPSVRILIGSVKNTRIGLIKMLTNAITAAATRAVTKFEIVIPGTTHPTNIIARAKPIHFKNNTPI